MATAPPATLQSQPMTPEQKKQFDLICKQALELLLHDKVAEMIVSKAKMGDPKQVVADTLLDLMPNISAAAKQAGVQLDVVAAMVAGVQIIGILAEMLQHQGVLPNDMNVMQQFISDTSALSIKKQNDRAQQASGAQPGQPPQGAPQGGPPPAPPPQGGGMMNAPQGA